MVPQIAGDKAALGQYLLTLHDSLRPAANIDMQMINKNGSSPIAVCAGSYLTSSTWCRPQPAGAGCIQGDRHRLASPHERYLA